MASENLIKQTIAVFTEIERRLVDPTFRISQGGATILTISKFLDRMAKEFGCVTKERLVDFCVCTAYAFRERGQWTVKQAFGPVALQRLKDKKKGAFFYEDRWLASADLSRESLVRMIADRSEHPQAKYIYVHSEEGTKARLLNQEIGYILCQTSTLGWSPVSETCKKCNFTEQCKKETANKYPELYRIRVEYGESNK